MAPPEAPAKTQKKPKKLKASVPSQSSPHSYLHTHAARTDVWVRGTANNGLEYFYNTVTGGELMFETHTRVRLCSSSLTVCLISESRWEKPDGFVDESSSSATGQMQVKPPVRESVCESVSL